MSDGTDPDGGREEEEEREGEGEFDPFVELGDVEAEVDSDPFAELEDAPLGERTPATDDDLFEAMDRDELDDEAEVVDRVLEGEGVETTADAVGTPDGAAAEAVPDRDEVVVSKRRYCEGCRYFTTPPETACEHPGTDILELVDVEHFRVADCPVVEWRRDLEAYPDPEESTTDPRE
ncbi:hypothetical protein ACFQNI_20040 [Salinirubellus salinus]|uniref:hypothetical protein n=1 Tax=Salinirubellus salinus TaxID=1364945 RepID=UPI003609DAFD